VYTEDVKRVYDTELWRKLANTYMSVGQAQDALQAVEEIVKRNPNDARAFLEKAFALHELGRVEEAEACYRRAIELFQQDLANPASRELLQASMEGLHMLRKGKPPPIARPWEGLPPSPVKPQRHSGARGKRRKKKHKKRRK